MNMSLNLKNTSSKMFLVDRENIAGFHIGATWRIEIEKINIPSDAIFVLIPFSVEIQEDKTALHGCSDAKRKGVCY